MAAKKTDEQVMTMELYQRLEQNEVRLGGRIAAINTFPGSEKKDRDGNPIINPDGSIAVWPDSHFVEFVFQGGKANFRVDPQTAATLAVGKRYSLLGHVALKTPKDGKPYPVIELDSFDLLF